MKYLESQWAVMDDAQLRDWCRTQWGLWIDGFPSDRRGVEKVMIALQSFLRERGKEALYAEEKAAGQARLARKKRGEPYLQPRLETQPMTTSERLAAPFPPNEIEWKPKNVTGTRCLAMPYLEVTAVLDRLDQVVGPENWADDYQVLAGGCVQCTLRVRIAGEWIGKTDVGSPSDQPDAGDKMKAAYTDSLKRAGARWGIGRYLRRLDRVWADYDAKSKKIVKVPTLPSWALPRPTAGQAPAGAPSSRHHENGSAPGPENLRDATKDSMPVVSRYPLKTDGTPAASPTLPAWSVPAAPDHLRDVTNNNSQVQPVNGLPKPLSLRGEAFARPSWDWRDRLVKGFSEATSWQSAQAVHASIPDEIKQRLEPGDAEAVANAWKLCQGRLRPKTNA